MKTVTIEKYDFIKCDNGKMYEVTPNWKEDYDYFLVENGSHKTVNEVNDNYLNESYEDGQPICVGEDTNRNPIYARITEVYNIRGVIKN